MSTLYNELRQLTTNQHTRPEPDETLRYARRPYLPEDRASILELVDRDLDGFYFTTVLPLCLREAAGMGKTLLEASLDYDDCDSTFHQDTWVTVYGDNNCDYLVERTQHVRAVFSERVLWAIANDTQVCQEIVRRLANRLGLRVRMARGVAVPDFGFVVSWDAPRSAE